MSYHCCVGHIAVLHHCCVGHIAVSYHCCVGHIAVSYHCCVGHIAVSYHCCVGHKLSLCCLCKSTPSIHLATDEAPPPSLVDNVPLLPGNGWVGLDVVHDNWHPIIVCGAFQHQVVHLTIWHKKCVLTDGCHIPKPRPCLFSTSLFPNRSPNIHIQHKHGLQLQIPFLLHRTLSSKGDNGRHSFIHST